MYMSGICCAHAFARSKNFAQSRIWSVQGLYLRTHAFRASIPFCLPSAASGYGMKIYGLSLTLACPRESQSFASRRPGPARANSRRHVAGCSLTLESGSNGIAHSKFLIASEIRSLLTSTQFSKFVQLWSSGTTDSARLLLSKPSRHAFLGLSSGPHPNR